MKSNLDQQHGMRFLLSRASIAIFVLWLQPVSGTDSLPDRKLIDEIPIKGNAPEDFVLRGWSVENVVTGDLNRDAKQDAVVIMTENKSTPLDDGRRLLVVLFRKANDVDQFLRVSTSLKVLRCRSCFGALAGPNGGQPTVSISPLGILIINQLWGSRETIERTLRFRFNEKLSKIVLIGEDVKRTDRGTGVSATESTNFLTGEQIVESYSYSEKNNREIRTSSTKKHVLRSVIFLEDATSG